MQNHPFNDVNDQQTATIHEKRSLPASILFLCTQNAVRSPMAAGIMKKLFGKKTFIDSAGICAKEVDYFATSVMQEIDIDISNHVPLSIEAMTISSFDLIICFSDEACAFAKQSCKTIATEFEYWPVYDPVNQAEKRDDQLMHYRKLRDQLQQLLQDRFGN